MMQPTLLYILKEKTPVPCYNVLEWSVWFETADRAVDKTALSEKVEVSTIFLGINCFFSSHPILFETMIFGGAHDGYQQKYATWQEAEQGHWLAVQLAWEAQDFSSS